MRVCGVTEHHRPGDAWRVRIDDDLVPEIGIGRDIAEVGRCRDEEPLLLGQEPDLVLRLRVGGEVERQCVESRLGAAEIREVLADGLLAIDREPRQDLDLRILRLQLLVQRLEGGAVLRRPPGCDVAIAVELGSGQVESVGDLMSDHGADPAVVGGGVGLRIEEGRLQDGRGEDDLVPGGAVEGIDDKGGGIPRLTVDRLADRGELLPVRLQARGGDGRVKGIADRHVLVRVPDIGVTDLDGHQLQLLDRLELRLLAHPGGVQDALAKGRDEIADQFFDLRLRLGREGDFHIRLAERVREEVLGGVERGLLVRSGLADAAQDALELLRDGLDLLGQGVGGAPDQAGRQLVAQRRGRGGDQHLLDAAKVACVADDDRIDVSRDAERAEPRSPRERRDRCLQLGDRARVVSQRCVCAVVHLRCHEACQLGVKGEDILRGGERVGLAVAAGGQQAGRRLDPRLANRFVLRRVFEVVGLVRQAEPAGAEVRDGGGRVVGRWACAHPEEAADIVLHALSGEIGHQLLGRGDGCQMVQGGLDRADALGIARLPVERHVVDEAYLAEVGTVVRCEAVDDRRELGVDALVDLVEGREAAPASREGGAIHPSAVGEPEEVVSRRHRKVHIRDLNAVPGPGSGRRRGRCHRRLRGRDGAHLPECQQDDEQQRP